MLLITQQGDNPGLALSNALNQEGAVVQSVFIIDLKSVPKIHKAVNHQTYNAADN